MTMIVTSSCASVEIPVFLPKRKKMMKKRHFMTILVISLILMSCTSRQNEILQNKTFSEAQKIAMEKNQNFCIVLLDTTNLTSRIYLERLKKNPIKTVFNMVDVKLPQNKWYGQWLYSNSVPITCIFAPSGELIDIIPGASHKCFNCIEQVVEMGKMCMGLAYYSNFSMNKEQIIPLLNDVFHCNLELQNRIDIEAQIDHLLSSVNYPYTVYLKMMNSVKHNKLDSAQLAAKQLLAFEDAWELEIYPDFLTTAKGVINPNYDVRMEPRLECDAIIELDDCKIGIPKLFEIKIFNSGIAPLNIQEIQLSCSCVKLIGDEVYTIPPGKTQYINFEFTIDKNEEVEREIILKSNGVYPIRKIRIVANSSSQSQKKGGSVI